MNFRKLIRGKYAFGSARLTLYNLIGLTTVYLAGLLIPQKGLLGEQVYYAWRVASPRLVMTLDSLGITEIYSSWFAYILLGLFFINLSINLALRTGVAIRKTALKIKDFDSRFIEHQQVFSNLETSVTNIGEVMEKLEVGLQELGFKTSLFGTKIGPVSRIFAVKNRYAPIGSIIFHLSFFPLLIGGLLLFYTRFSGTVILGNGEFFNGNQEEYMAISREPLIKGRELPNLKFQVTDVKPVYKQGRPNDLTVKLKSREAGFDVDRSIRINYPYKKGSIYVLVTDIGIAPLIKLKDLSGMELEGAYYKLNVMRGQEEMLKLRSSKIPLLIRFYPDYVLKNGIPASASFEVKNPVFFLRAFDGDKELFKAQIRPGETVRFGGYFLEIGKDLEYWVQLSIIDERGGGTLWVGFIICTVGLILRLAVRRIELYALLEVGEDRSIIKLGGSAEHLGKGFKLDFQSMTEGLANSIGANKFEDEGGK